MIHATRKVPWHGVSLTCRNDRISRLRGKHRLCPLSLSVPDAGAIQRSGETGTASRDPSARPCRPGSVPAPRSPARPWPARISSGSPSSTRRSFRKRHPSPRRGRACLRPRPCGHINSIVAELRPISRLHGQHPSTSTRSLGLGVNKAGGSPFLEGFLLDVTKTCG